MQSKIKISGEVNIDIFLTYILEILSNEINNASIIREDIDKLDEQIKNLNKLLLEDKKQLNDNNLYFKADGIKNIEENELILYDKIEAADDEIKRKKTIIEKKLNDISILENIINYFNDIISDDKDSEINDNDTKDSKIGINILETQEMERSRIARDLHDSTIQSLTSLVHRTELCTRLLDIDTIRAKLELMSMTASLKTIIDDMRDIIYNLRPMSLNDLGLYVTVKRLLDKINNQKGIQTELILEQNEKELNQIITLTLFRIIQEACNNIIKHAEAEKIIIKIEYINENIIVEIYDNGKGFNIQNEKIKRKDSGYGLGLSIMEERVLLLKGDIKIESKCGKGTKVIINIPIVN